MCMKTLFIKDENFYFFCELWISDSLTKMIKFSTSTFLRRIFVSHDKYLKFQFNIKNNFWPIKRSKQIHFVKSPLSPPPNPIKEYFTPILLGLRVGTGFHEGSYPVNQKPGIRNSGLLYDQLLQLPGHQWFSNPNPFKQNFMMVPWMVLELNWSLRQGKNKISWYQFAQCQFYESK